MTDSGPNAQLELEASAVPRREHSHSWPRARSDALIEAAFKTTPADFIVTETLPFIPSGDGEHLFVRLQKSAMTTPELARLLADAHGLAPVDVGYAGMKDKRSVSSQWFSLRGASVLEEKIAAVAGLQVLDVTRHGQKLRRGQIEMNEFEIVLRDLSPGPLEQGLQTLQTQGAPNYFGSQRFGWDNVEQATAWLAVRRHRRISKFKQGLYLSVLRSLLFNEVLAARVSAGTWQAPVDGDSICAGQASGPLWGRGRSSAAGLAAEIESRVLEPYAEICQGLEHAGLKQDRRSFVLEPVNLRWQQDGTDLRLTFGLASGGYATSLLGELFDLRQAQ